MSQQVTVIIPVKDDQSGIDTVLSLIEKQSYPLDLIEVVVVDNNSSPPLKLARDYVFFCRVLLESKPSGFASRNKAIQHAKGEIIAFTDADCLPTPGWIAGAVAALERDTSITAVGGRVEIFTSESPTPSEMYEMVFAFPQEHYINNLHFSVTANLIVRKEVFEFAGLFDEILKSGGDNEWGNRHHRSGGKMVFVDSLLVRHPARDSWKELSKKIKRTITGYCNIRCNKKLTLKVFFREIIADLVPLRPLLTIIKTDKVSSIINKSIVFGIAIRLKFYRVSVKIRFLLKRV
ncbi:glycosyltransferase [bacterium]|nr:glycosyltransferase [bacterium]